MRLTEERRSALVLWSAVGLSVVLVALASLLVARFAPDLEVPVAVGALVAAGALGLSLRGTLAPGTYRALDRFLVSVGALIGCIILAAVLFFLHGWEQAAVGLVFASVAASRFAYQLLARRMG